MRLGALGECVLQRASPPMGKGADSSVSDSSLGFVRGGRVEAGEYPMITRSYFLGVEVVVSVSSLIFTCVVQSSVSIRGVGLFSVPDSSLSQDTASVVLWSITFWLGN